MPSRRFVGGGGYCGGGWGFTAGMYRPQAQTGTPIPEEGGKEPPPYRSMRNNEQWMREQTAANLAMKADALAPKRWSPKPDVSESTEGGKPNGTNENLDNSGI